MFLPNKAHNCAQFAPALALTFLFAIFVRPGNAEEPVASAEPASAAQQVEVAGLSWHTDYFTAYREAKSQQRMLLINFLSETAGSVQSDLEQYMAANSAVWDKLARFVRVRLPVETQVELEGVLRQLIKLPAFQHLRGNPGLAVIDLTDRESRHFGRVVSAFPFQPGKYYRWKVDHLPVILDLPPGSITQRTMIWAVRVHPERPASTSGRHDGQLARAARQHSQHQADLGVQGHHRWEERFHQIRGRVGAGEAVEVVAESWPNQNMLDSCIDCVASWRQSTGHWGAVRRRHRKYGYDIRRGLNGIWYGTGIFAN